MARSRLLVVLTVLLAFGLAGVALADSAGDNQYQDPFANTQPQNTTPQTTTAPAPATLPAPAQTTTAPSNASTGPAATSKGSQLPRTGLDLRLVGGLGVLLLGGGLLLRRRLA